VSATLACNRTWLAGPASDGPALLQYASWLGGVCRHAVKWPHECVAPQPKYGARLARRAHCSGVNGQRPLTSPPVTCIPTPLLTAPCRGSNLILSGAYTDFSPSWYVDVGQSLQLLIIINAVVTGAAAARSSLFVWYIPCTLQGPQLQPEAVAECPALLHGPFLQVVSPLQCG